MRARRTATRHDPAGQAAEGPRRTPSRATAGEAPPTAATPPSSDPDLPGSRTVRVAPTAGRPARDRKTSGGGHLTAARDTPKGTTDHPAAARIRVAANRRTPGPARPPRTISPPRTVAGRRPPLTPVRPKPSRARQPKAPPGRQPTASPPRLGRRRSRAGRPPPGRLARRPRSVLPPPARRRPARRPRFLLGSGLLLPLTPPWKEPASKRSCRRPGSPPGGLRRT